MIVRGYEIPLFLQIPYKFCVISRKDRAKLTITFCHPRATKKRRLQSEPTLSLARLAVDLVLHFFGQVNSWLFDTFTNFVTDKGNQLATLAGNELADGLVAIFNEWLVS